MKGKVQFNDMNILKSTIKDFNKLGEALTYIANFEKMEGVRQQFEKAAENTKDRNQKAKFRQQLKGLTSIKNLAKDQGLYQAPDFLENLTFVLDYGFQDQFEVQMPIEPYIFSSNFNGISRFGPEKILKLDIYWKHPPINFAKIFSSR